MQDPLLSNQEVVSEEYFLEDEGDDRIQLLTEEEDEEDELYLEGLAKTGVSPFVSKFNILGFKEALSKILNNNKK